MAGRPPGLLALFAVYMMVRGESKALWKPLHKGAQKVRNNPLTLSQSKSGRPWFDKAHHERFGLHHPF